MNEQGVSVLPSLLMIATARVPTQKFEAGHASGSKMSFRGRGSAGLHVWLASPGPVGVVAGVRMAETRFNRLFT